MRWMLWLCVVAACSTPSDDPPSTPLPEVPDAAVDAEPVPDPIPDPVPDPIPDPVPDPTLTVDVVESGEPHTKAIALPVDAVGVVGAPVEVGDTGHLEAVVPGGGLLVTVPSTYDSRADPLDLYDVFYFVAPTAGAKLLCPTGVRRVNKVSLEIPSEQTSYRAVFGNQANHFDADPKSTLTVNLDAAALPLKDTAPLLLLGFDAGNELTEYGFTPDVSYDDGMVVATPAMKNDLIDKQGGKVLDAPAGAKSIAVQTEIWVPKRGLMAVLDASAGDEWVGRVLTGPGFLSGVRAVAGYTTFKVTLDGMGLAEVVPTAGIGLPIVGETALELGKLLPQLGKLTLTSSPWSATWKADGAIDDVDGGVLRLTWKYMNGEREQVVRWTIVVPPGAKSVTLPALPKVVADFAPPKAATLTVELGIVDVGSITSYAQFLDAWSNPRPSVGTAMRWTRLE